MGEQTEVPKGNRPDGFQARREPSEGAVARGVGRDGAEPAASSLQPAGRREAEGVPSHRALEGLGGRGGVRYFMFLKVFTARGARLWRSKNEAEGRDREAAGVACVWPGPWRWGQRSWRMI